MELNGEPYKVVCDASNNPQEVRDRGGLVVDIYLDRNIYALMCIRSALAKNEIMRKHLTHLEYVQYRDIRK